MPSHEQIAMTMAECKVVFLGNANAGKTCLLTRYAHGHFNPLSQTTICGACAEKTEVIGDATIKLRCWDTAGNERYKSLTRMYLRDSKAAILCFDLRNEKSFESLKEWTQELLFVAPSCKLYVCGTKKDIVDDNPKSRAVDIRETKWFAKDLAADYIETSSKSCENVDELFKTIAKDFMLTESFEDYGSISSWSGSISLSWKKIDPRLKNNTESCCSK